MDKNKNEIKKYEHRYNLSITWKPIWTNYQVIIFSNDKIISRTYFEKKIEETININFFTYSIINHYIFLNK